MHYFAHLDTQFKSCNFALVYYQTNSENSYMWIQELSAKFLPCMDNIIINIWLLMENYIITNLGYAWNSSVQAVNALVRM